MAQAVASKFSVLRVEDEDGAEWKTTGGGSGGGRNKGSNGHHHNNHQQQVQDAPPPKPLPPGLAGPNSHPHQNNSNNVQKQQKKLEKKDRSQKKKEAKMEIEQLKSLAFGAPKKAKGKGGAGGKQLGGDQWQEWKKRDLEFVTEAYEQDMQQAMLLSKLDYEEKKDFYDEMKKDRVNLAANDGSKGKEKAGKKKEKKEKKGKNQPMSLEQFNNLQPSQIDSHESSPSVEGVEKPTSGSKKKGAPASVTPAVEKDPEFFDRIADEAKAAVRQEKEREEKKEATRRRDKYIPELIKMNRFEEELKAKEEECRFLRKEVEKLRVDLQNVKTRNKKLCNILAQGEMRDKAEVIVEMERLRKVKDELTEEVSSLSGQLEQERSKVSNLTSELKKNQGKKKNNSSND